jgi:hypothetical protein
LNNNTQFSAGLTFSQSLLFLEVGQKRIGTKHFNIDFTYDSRMSSEPFSLELPQYQRYCLPQIISHIVARL